MGAVDYFVLHQANSYILHHLAGKIGVSPERMPVTFAEVGNTASVTIPLALEAMCADGRLQPGATLMLVGFGVGLSWAACIARWRLKGRVA